MLSPLSDTSGTRARSHFSLMSAVFSSLPSDGISEETDGGDFGVQEASPPQSVSSMKSEIRNETILFILSPCYFTVSVISFVFMPPTTSLRSPEYTSGAYS